MAELQTCLTEELAKLSRNHDLAKAINYMLRRWPAFTRFLDDGRVCLSNNAAERALRCVALRTESWLFCGSDRRGQRAAVMYTLIGTAKLNDVDPQGGPPTSSPASPSNRPTALMNCCLGTGPSQQLRSPPEGHRARGPRRMQTELSGRALPQAC
jgi:hypothetical protein